MEPLDGVRRPEGLGLVVGDLSEGDAFEVAGGVMDAYVTQR